MDQPTLSGRQIAIYVAIAVALIYHVGVAVFVFRWSYPLPYPLAAGEMLMAIAGLLAAAMLYGYYQIRGIRIAKLEQTNAMLRRQLGRSAVPERRNETWVGSAWRDRHPTAQLPLLPHR